MGHTISNLCSSDSLRNITHACTHKGETDRERENQGRKEEEREGRKDGAKAVRYSQIGALGAR